MEVFKEPLEDPKMQLLNQTQMKIIFGNVSPILEVHEMMLSDLRACLRDWREETTRVGDVLLRHADEMLKVYPPFVNFFEDTKKTVEECDKNIPRWVTSVEPSTYDVLVLRRYMWIVGR